MEIVVGVALVLLGATAATVTARDLDERGRGRLIPIALAPFGVLIGAGAATVRGGDPLLAAIVGAVVLPLLALVSQVVARRRRAR